MQKLMANTQKIMIKIKNSHILSISMRMINRAAQSHKKWPVNGFKRPSENTSQFNEDFIEN